MIREMMVPVAITVDERMTLASDSPRGAPAAPSTASDTASSVSPGGAPGVAPTRSLTWPVRAPKPATRATAGPDRPDDPHDERDGQQDQRPADQQLGDRAEPGHLHRERLRRAEGGTLRGEQASHHLHAAVGRRVRGDVHRGRAVRLERDRRGLDQAEADRRHGRHSDPHGHLLVQVVHDGHRDPAAAGRQRDRAWLDQVHLRLERGDPLDHVLGVRPPARSGRPARPRTAPAAGPACTCPSRSARW